MSLFAFCNVTINNNNWMDSRD